MRSAAMATSSIGISGPALQSSTADGRACEVASVTPLEVDNLMGVKRPRVVTDGARAPRLRNVTECNWVGRAEEERLVDREVVGG